jgi:hypothetical protein
MVRHGNKRTEATAAGVDFAAATGASLRISCVHPFGCGTAQPFGATPPDSVLFGKSNNPFLWFPVVRVSEFARL